MRRFKLFTIAVLGSIIGYFAINTFIVQVNIFQYLVIEFIVTILHTLYNVAKNQEQPA